jgi:peptidoglycan/LPS O-acetylase OafA/YrhL
MRHHLWLAVLVVATIAFTLVFACAAPFAAFGAAAALTLSRRDALLVTVVLWLANQLTGFVALGYSWTLNSVAWAPTLAVAAMLATLTAQWTVRRLNGARDIVRALAALVLAFAVFEVAIFLVSAALLGGLEMYTPSIVGQVLVTNVAALVGLYGLNWLGGRFGLRRRVEAPVSA